MAQDPPVRPKRQDLYTKMHLGLDHVMAKLLLDAPPLPESLKLQTETQSLSKTWSQISSSFEKRKVMLQNRKQTDKEKKKKKKKDAKQQEEPVKKQKTPKEKIKQKKVQKSSKKSPAVSPNSGRNSPRVVKTERKKVKSPRVVKTERTVHSPVTAAPEVSLDSYDAFLLKKLRKQPLCENLVYGTNKYNAIVKWLEVDNGKDGGASSDLMKLLAKMARASKTTKPSLSRKRSLESLDEALEAERRRKRKGKQRLAKENKEDDEEEEEMEYGGGYSDSDEAEFMPELYDSPPRGEKAKTRARGRPSKKQKKHAEEEEEKSAVSVSTTSSKDHLDAVVAKIRADKVVLGDADTKYLSYDKTATPGNSSHSAIVLDDSEEEEEEEEETKETEPDDDHESSTDEDNDLFDLNEEDVYVVEAILCVKEGRALLSAGVRRPKEADLYLVKWDGYDELTWEPDENIPQRLIEMFRERERAKRACQYQIKTYHERKVVMNVTTGTREVIYMLQWINQELPVWEARSTLPAKTALWLDKVLGAGPSSSKKRRDTKLAKQYIYQ
ncbi:hypothetical protein PHYBOEH_001620 [Phytophthora boehmeriae]|uniref:Chromo domain-containing protein n=1 Tax=Phytophthora boehmeriae TaxID=109152 RepID=A0A8T1WYN6_9STRA|nr:hypothetical protein PHYBOEH_001620 [Phytophthora boehmeriae]